MVITATRDIPARICIMHPATITIIIARTVRDGKRKVCIENEFKRKNGSEYPNRSYYTHISQTIVEP